MFAAAEILPRESLGQGTKQQHKRNEWVCAVNHHDFAFSLQLSATRGSRLVVRLEWLAGTDRVDDSRELLSPSRANRCPQLSRPVAQGNGKAACGTPPELSMSFGAATTFEPGSIAKEKAVRFDSFPLR